MTQLFPPGTDARLRGLALVGAAVLVLAGTFAFAWARSDGAWRLGVPAPQPIPFSHAIHAGGLGLDCRFCHAGVERGAEAGMPTAETCLGCHAQVWNVSAQLQPLHTALALDVPVAWASVHRLPGHVRFAHAPHLGVGLDCATCHGAVASMPRTVKAETLSMGFCLDCHREAQPARAARHAHQGIPMPPLADCSTCHR